MTFALGVTTGRYLRLEKTEQFHFLPRAKFSFFRAEISDSKVKLVALDSDITVLRREYGIERVTV